MNASDLTRYRCHWCLEDIVYSAIAKQWWHARTGAVHCSGDGPYRLHREHEACPVLKEIPFRRGIGQIRARAPGVSRRIAEPPQRA